MTLYDPGALSLACAPLMTQYPTNLRLEPPPEEEDQNQKIPRQSAPRIKEPDDTVDVLSAVEDPNLKKSRQFTPRVDPMPLPVFTAAGGNMTNARTSTTTHPDSLHALTTTRIPAKDQKNPDPTMPRQFAPRAEELTNTLTRRGHEERAGLHHRATRPTRKCSPPPLQGLQKRDKKSDDAAAKSAAEDETTSNDTAALRAVEGLYPMKPRQFMPRVEDLKPLPEPITTGGDAYEELNQTRRQLRARRLLAVYPDPAALVVAWMR
ncbi:hypothetical protein B0F90DRAFT_1669021 [Multifurca ochricompacta]|uniref:Uncharacterized protein n=1 Tax=Multifurca ochricompacta TaxID=376703 RepID=A0AAD4M3P2_9AGAM|nr:hypothetical protein B0F90DRAFT_1669021 [Multifurca ochricompacta]